MPENGIFLDLETLLAVAGVVLTPLLTVIGALWLALNNERKAHNDTRDKAQEKMDAVTAKALEAINSASNQANSSSALLVGMKDVISKLEENIQRLREELMRGVGRKGE